MELNESIKVKLFKNGKQLVESNFSIYSRALTYAMKEVEKGYSCLILRLVNNKSWVKLWLNPSETM